jgi:hypothetical protein
MRKSKLISTFFAIAFMACILTGFDAAYQQDAQAGALHRRAMLVGQLGLSDLALFTEARYTRNLSLADRHAAFQDHPMSFDHFPSGSLVLPPAHLSDDGIYPQTDLSD